MAISKIIKNSIGSDAIDATKVADDAISEEHLDVTAVTGHTELSETAADNDVLLVFDTSAGVLKKIQRSNIALAAPTFTSVSPTNATSGDGTGNYTFTITGTNFDANVTAKLRTTGGADVSFDTVTRNSATQLTCAIAKSNASLTNDNEPFDVVITNGSGLTVIGANQINIDASPAFVTAAGSLGSGRFSMAGVSVNATDPESAGNVTFELQSGSLPTGISLVNTAAEGGTALFSGTFSSLATNDTTFNFVLRAVDAASNTSSRAFSFVQSGPVYQSFTSSGTFSVPTGLTSVDVLIVAGGGSGGSEHGSTGNGGGGAGGLVFVPSFSVTPGGTVSVTVGCGGAGIPDSTSGQGNDGQDSVFGTLTAKGGGGGGGNPSAGRAGGSGGGGGGPCGAAGSANQSTQSGQSGAYGFGNNGGSGGTPSSPVFGAGGGGGGAGGAGTNGQPASAGGDGGPGGVGKVYTIADGTTPVYYAGGGGGSASNVPGAAQGNGGQGGGSAGQDSGNTADGGANKGGGTGGARAALATGTGGKGIVIVKY